MPTVSYTGTFAACGRRVLALIEQSATAAEFVVVFDGEPPPAPAWLKRPRVTLVATGRRSGPAVARNFAANSASGRILFFVDADVELDWGGIDRVCNAFDADPDLAGLFGAYDDEPAADGVISQFRNLLHHHTHVAHPGQAHTFWSGCGAIAANVFSDIGGFDESYAFPSVEDIDLGLRVTAEKGKILLDPNLRCKHLKQWTLPSMVVADIFYRATPWTELILESKHLPATLNIDWRGRFSGALSLVLAASVVALPFIPLAAWTAAAATIGLIVMNAGFYGLCLRKRGFGFAAKSVALHFLYFLYSTVTFAAVVCRESLRGPRRADACLSSSSNQHAMEHGATEVALAPQNAR